MTGIEVIDVARESLMAYAKVAGPLLIVTLVVGVVISFLQAVTQIQEQTLTFVPKIIITGFAMMFFLPFMGDALTSYMAALAARIIQGG